MGRTSALRFTAGSALSPMHPPGSAFSPMPTASGSTHSPMHGRGVPPSELATALRRSRSGIFREGDDTAYRAPFFPAAEPRQRWETQVRIDIAIATLMSGLVFVPGDQTAQWWHMEVGDPSDTSKSPTSVPLVKLEAPSDSTFRGEQLAQVMTASNDRDDRMPEILTQADGLWPFWTSITNIDSALTPATVELMEALLGVTHLVVMRTKNALAVPRPVDLSSTLGPIIPTPGHGSFPSGHATVAFMFAGFMRRVLGLDASSQSTFQGLFRLAHRIAQNRVVAGVHFPMDSVAGRVLGETLAEYFFARCTGLEAKYNNASLTAPDLTPGFNLELEPDPIGGPCKAASSSNVVKSVDGFIKGIWGDVQDELTMLGLLP